MASKLSKVILDEKGKSIIETNCALICQVDVQRHMKKHWAWGAKVLSDSALEDTSARDCNLCSEPILHLQHFAYFLDSIFLKGEQFSRPTLCKDSN